MLKQRGRYQGDAERGHIYIIPHLAYIPKSHDLTGRNIYIRSNQTDKVIKQWEMYEGPGHPAEQVYEKSVPIKSDKGRL